MEMAHARRLISQYKINMHDLKRWANGVQNLQDSNITPHPLSKETHMSDSQQMPQGGVRQDIDHQETREWIDALTAVIEKEGPERAHFLLEQLLEQARQSSIDMPFSANTAYVTRSRPRTRRVARATSRSRAPALLHALERDGDGRQGQPPRPGGRR